jgi:PilZ domain
VNRMRHSSPYAAEKDRGPSISVQVHRSRRFPFVAGVQVTALDNDAQVAAHIEDLSLFGCFVETVTPFVAQTKVSIRISHNGTVFVAQGRVAYSRAAEGMGIAFTSIEASSVSTLDDWLTELRKEAADIACSEHPSVIARYTF